MLSTLYIIEKHREAILWSYLVAAVDRDASGSYSYDERFAIRMVLQSVRKGDRLIVRKPNRPSTGGAPYYAQRLVEAGLHEPFQTTYRWSSQDGYPYIGNLHQLYPNLNGDNAHFCSMSLQKCFGRTDFFNEVLSDDKPIMTPEELFKHQAFRKPSCGDCLIAALVTASGAQGLSAFLPAKDAMQARRQSSKTAAEFEVPFIGDFNLTWQDTDFSLRIALGDRWKPRDFSVRLIQRYSYTLGETQAFLFFHIVTESM